MATIVGLLWLGALVARADRYVVMPGTPGGTNAGAYTNWSIAATNIQWAVNVATSGEKVWVTNGTYVLTNQITTKTNGVTIIGVNGNYPNTTNRCFLLTNHNVILDGFTITNGAVVTLGAAQGGGIYLSNSGIVQRCNIKGNFVSGSNRFTVVGGGVYISDNNGKVLDCSISANIISNQYSGDIAYAGAGIYLNGGVVSNCSVFTNVALGAYTHGGGLGFGNANALAVNCTIYSNYAGRGGGGVDMIYGTLRNSVITRNKAGWGGDGVHMSYAIMEGCLIYNNNTYGVYAYYNNLIRNCTVSRHYGGIGVLGDAKVENTISAYNSWMDWYCIVYSTNTYTATNSCFLLSWNIGYPIPGSGNISSVPQFVDTNTANYQLTSSSPCINAGVNQAWMNGAVDLNGRSRIDRFSGQADMGCYEYLPSGVIFGIR